MDVDTIKQVYMKEKIRKEYLEKTRKLLKPCSAAEISSKGQIPGLSPCKILGSILEKDKGRTSTNGPEDKKDNDDAKLLKSEKWHRVYVSRKEGGIGLASIEDFVDVSIRELEAYTKKCKERLITATKTALATE